MFLELHPCESNPVFYLDLKGFLSMIIFKKIIFKKLFAPIALLLCFTLSLSLTGCSASSAQPFSKTGFYFDTVSFHKNLSG